MKKFLSLIFSVALFSTTQAQNTFTSGSWNSWNMDTLKFSGTTSAGIAYGESKTINTVGNATINIQVLVATKLDTMDTGGLTVIGSMDNTNWAKVELNKSWYPSPVFVTKSPVTAYAGTWPNIRLATPDIAYLGTASNYTAADTIALPASPSLKAGNAVMYYITLVNPQYHYYKLVTTMKARANTNAKITSLFMRYWTRKPY